MTMILSCKYMDKVFLIADSRVTWVQSSKYIFEDSLQKILPLTSNTVIGYCGDIKTAELIVRKTREHILKKAKRRNIHLLTKDITRISRYYHSVQKKSTKQECEVNFILASLTSSGKSELIKYSSPGFEAINILERLEVIGSGQVIKEEINKNLDIIDTEVDDTKMFGLALISKIEDSLKRNKVDTVGGLFQVLIISSDGIYPLNYTSVTLDPDNASHGKSMRMEQQGEWVQRDFESHSKVTLCEPMYLNNYPKEVRIKDFHKNNEISIVYKWYLNYFIICSNVSKEPDGGIEFSEVTSVLGISNFPAQVELNIAIGFRGTRGEHELQLIVGQGMEQICTFNQNISISHLLDEIDLEIPLAIDIKKPGPIFLDCVVKGQIIGRHCIYIGNIPLNITSSHDMEITVKSIIAEQEASIDPVIENNSLSMMMYQFISMKAVCEESLLRFENQIQRIFYQQYPVEVPVYVTCGIAMPKGDHDLQINLVNAVTQEVILISKERISTISSCKITNISGIQLLKFEGSGIYYLNTYIDNCFIGTRILYANTYNEIKQYGLQVEEDTIKQGILIVLYKHYK